MARKTTRTMDANAVAAHGYDLSTGTHGTFLRQGQTEVTPASKSGMATNFPETDPSVAYYSAHKWGDPSVAERKGWNWAHQAATPTDRPVVHEVVPKPGSTIDQDPYTKKWRETQGGAVTSSKGLDIVDTHWIPMVTAREKESGVKGIQGTLPNVNWNQFNPRGDITQSNWKVLR